LATTDLEMNTHKDTDHDLEHALALIASYWRDGYDDWQLPKIFRVIRETCPNGYDRILLLAYTVKKHRERFDQFVFADLRAILLDFEMTDEMAHDAERLLDLMWHDHADTEVALLDADNFYLAKAREYVDNQLNLTGDALVQFVNE
jgi:hypothetical protein